MSKHQVERARHPGQIERIDEQARIADLPPAAAAEPAAKLILGGSSLPRGLLLERAEGSEVSLGLGDPLDGRGPESSDQLVLEISDAHVEAEPLHVGASEIRAESGSLETAAEVALLAGVAETRQPNVEPCRAEPMQEPSDRLGASDRHDGDAFRFEIPADAARRAPPTRSGR